MMKTDKELQRDILDELTWEPRVDAADIGVSVEDGVVILNGRAKSLIEKWVAERVAQRVEGVRAVTDEIAVKLPGDSQYGDADIAHAAANALDWHVSVPRSRIKVVVEDGWIALKGNVDYQYQKEAAEDAIRGLRGVKGVRNTIIVTPPSISPGNINQKIEKALERAAQVDAQKITVETEGGKVILHGDVRTWAEREEAERAAWAAPGVFAIENDIRIAA
jgi:osmotically-inducible protein OsmY